MAQCEVCGRGFARNEHLARHLRIHTGERPFHCTHCKAGFQRPDVLAKHIQKLHPRSSSAAGHASGLSSTEESRRAKPKDRERSRLACDQCRKRKLKCNNIRPCESCRAKSLDCVVSSTSRPPGRPRNSTAALASPVEPSATSAGLSSIREPSAESCDPVPPPALEQWTPSSSDDPPSQTLDSRSSVITHTHTTSNSDQAIADESAYFGGVNLTVPGVDEWMATNLASLPTVQGAFAAPDMNLIPQSTDRMDFMDDIIPSADFGNWLDDLNELPFPDNAWPQNSTMFDVDFDASMESAVEMMKEQLERRSRASSPTREAQKRSWYSALPQLGVYDADVVNVLLNVARKHLSSTFAIFCDFEVGDETGIELCLAMAAVGGLHSTAPGSAMMAKMLYNDSRRLMLESYLNTADGTFYEYLGFALTFILLELYGLCSGNKRAFEFVEVFHGNKVHAATTCIRSLPPDATVEQRRRAMLLAEAMHVLDSYRVLLMQRPPSFAGEYLLGTGADNHVFRSNGAHLFTPSLNESGSFSGDLHHLSKVIRYCWMAGPRDPDNSNPVKLWKAEFIDLALYQWIQAKTASTPVLSEADAPQMLLFHLAHVSLQTNMGLLSILIHATAQRPSSRTPAAMDPQLNGTSNKNNSDNTTLGSSKINPWLTKRQFDIALWHAKTILRIAQDTMTPPRRRSSVESAKATFPEPPHLPLSVYFATLVVWFGEAKWDRRDVESSDSAIEVGSQLLFKMKVPVAKVLGTALCELLTT